MPVITTSSYQSPLLFQNGHIQTIYARIFRQVPKIKYIRERISTPDQDFIDLDWSKTDSKKLAVLCYGLESDSQANYVKGMVKALNHKKWDCVVFNFRGCSGEPNYQMRSYHSGVTEDLEYIIQYILKNYQYQKISLVGFSLGGNLILKYLGEKGMSLPSFIKTAVTISTPCDLQSSAIRLAQKENQIYMKRFLKKLYKKIYIKEKERNLVFPRPFSTIKNFKDFDDFYTAPIHGFKDAMDYWAKCSSRFFIPSIAIPTLLINAQNDPFLGPESFPSEITQDHDCFFLETPQSGGHMGFVTFGQNEYWHETRTLSFISEHT